MSYKSLTINERYNILKEFGKIEKENTDALIQWRNDMSLLSQKQLFFISNTVSVMKNVC